MNKRLLKILLILWLGIIWFVSSLPGDSLPKLETINIDKFAHVFVYFVLSILMLVNYRKGNFGNMSIREVFLAAVILASLDESHQVFIINRSVSVFDLLANLAGIFTGYIVSISKSKIK